MSRRGILTNLPDEKLTAVNSTPIRERQVRTSGAFGSVVREIDALAAKADAAREIEARLTAGEIVVELDPSEIDASFVADRLSQDDDEFQALVQAIRERGQDSPILVRRHPDAETRYQVAFGHRRVRAAQVLGRPVRAVVKQLTNRDLVLAQGQENSARANLSFVERALFARRLEEIGQDRETIMSALGVDKTVVEGVGLDQLKRGPGHYPETPLPGQRGNASIAGHRTTYGAPFHNLDKLAKGDRIEVTTVQGTFVYEVADTKIVGIHDVDVLGDKGDNRLTLTACHPKYSAKQRIIVAAVLKGTPRPPIVGQAEAEAKARAKNKDEKGNDAVMIDGGLSGRGEIVIENRKVDTVRRAWYPYTHPFNLTGNPAIVLPAGLHTDGLPTSVQIVASPPVSSQIILITCGANSMLSGRSTFVTSRACVSLRHSLMRSIQPG